MGCDGGTIAKRSDMVKTKSSSNGSSVDPKALQSLRLTTCALSHQPLTKPVVLCELGLLYNKEALVEYLLKKRTTVNGGETAGPNHIKSLADVIDVHPLFTSSSSSSSSNSSSKASVSSSSNSSLRSFAYQCPITGVPSSGLYRFFAVRSCGCVISEKAIKELGGGTSKVCIACSKPFSSSTTNPSTLSPSSSSSSSSSSLLSDDYIIICPSDSEREEMRRRWEIRQQIKKDLKKKLKTERTESVQEKNDTKMIGEQGVKRSANDINETDTKRTKLSNTNGSSLQSSAIENNIMKKAMQLAASANSSLHEQKRKKRRKILQEKIFFCLQFFGF